MIHRNEENPKDGRKWSITRNPSRAFIDILDKQGFDIYIMSDADGNRWAVYAMPLQVLDTGNGMM